MSSRSAQWLQDFEAAVDDTARAMVADVLALGNKVRDVVRQVQQECRARKSKLLCEGEEACKPLEREIDLLVASSKENSNDALEQYMSLIAKYREAQNSLESRLTSLDASFLDDERITSQIAALQSEIAKVETYVTEKLQGVSVPWQLRYCGEMDPQSNSQIVTFEGGKITDAEGRDIWEDRCYLLGVMIQSGAIGVGRLRYRSMDHPQVVRSELAHRWQSIMRCSDIDRFLNDDFVAETDHFVFSHITLVKFAVSAVQPPPVNSESTVSLARAAFAALKVYAGRPLLGTVDYSSPRPRYVFETFAQVLDKVLRIAHMLQLDFGGPPPCENSEFRSIGIWLDNCPEWLYVDFAAALNRYPSVGIHPLWPLDEVQHIVRHSKIAVLFASLSSVVQLAQVLEPQEAEKITVVTLEELRSVFGTAQALPATSKHVLPFSSSHLGEVALLREEDLRTATDLHAAMEVKCDENCPVAPNPQTRGVFTLMYTSGTTGHVKATEVTEKSWLEGNSAPHYDLEPVVVMSYAALAHGMDRGQCWTALLTGGRICMAYPPAPSAVQEKFARESSEKVREITLCAADHSVELPSIFYYIGLAEPSLFVASPDVWTPFAMYCNSFGCIKIVCETSEALETDAKRNRKIVQLKRHFFGRRIACCATGAAPTSPDVLKFCKLLLKAHLVSSESKERAETTECTFVDVYGSTEAPGISTEGILRSGIEIRLVDVPALGYSASDNVGEIHVRGAGTARRYFDDPEATAAVFTDDGWFRTGDVGVLDPETKSLRIVDRANNFLEMYVEHRSVWVPAYEAEAALLMPFVDESAELVHVERLCLFADRMQSFLVAVILVDDDRCALPLSLLSSNKELEHLLLEVLEWRCVKKRGKPQHWCPKGIVFEHFSSRSPNLWTVENGLLTPLGKVKRRALRDRFAEQLAQKFSAIEIEQAEQPS